jgi:hydrogenase nickel incorporation protein HypB
MCRSCGCDDHHHDHHHHDHDHHHHEARRIALEVDLLAKNDRLAGDVRLQLQRDHITAFNMIGAPGAGKTSLLERTSGELEDLAVAVLEGDQATDRDAKRIAATGAPVIQINTGAGCHLDATMVERGLAQLRPRPSSLLFVENVGNLVCPALFDLGEAARVVISSVTEGADKPIKYPQMFRDADLVLLSKIDLLPYLDFDAERHAADLKRVSPRAAVLAVSATTGEGLPAWYDWLRQRTRAA